MHPQASISEASQTAVEGFLSRGWSLRAVPEGNTKSVSGAPSSAGYAILPAPFRLGVEQTDLRLTVLVTGR